jgi:hypothetical protein
MSLFKSEIILDGKIPSEQARKKWDEAVDSGAGKVKIKGKSLFVHSRRNNKCVLHYYQSYASDLCDTMFTGEIFAYDENGSQITGKITVSSAMKRFAGILTVLAIPLAFVFAMILEYTIPYLYERLPFMRNILHFLDNWGFNFIGAAVTLAAIAVMCLIVDKRRVKDVMDYLHDFLSD